MPEDLLDKIFQSIYRFNNQMPRENYSQTFSEMKQIAVIDVETDGKDVKYAYDYPKS